MDPPPPLHAAHQVRETFDGLRIISWAVIGLAIGALVLVWGRIVVWLRSADAGVPELANWGRDGDEAWFEVRRVAATGWSVELESGELLETREAGPGLLRAPVPGGGKPVALVSREGVRLLL